MSTKDKIIEQQDKIIKLLTQSNNSLLDRVKEQNSALLEIESLTRFKKHSTNINHSLKQENNELRLTVQSLTKALEAEEKENIRLSKLIDLDKIA